MTDTANPSSYSNKITSYQDGDGNDEPYRFLYLSKEWDIRAAKNTVRFYARALGTKRCAHVIDSCFAKIFESCS